MIRLLQLLRPILPGPMWRRLSEAFWNRFWRLEQEEQARLAPQLPRKLLRGSERALLVEAVATVASLKNALELGCAYGQTLHVLAPLLSNVSFVGIDIDMVAVREGQALLRERGITNTELMVGDGADLARFGDGSFDVVYCIACLLYVSEEQIDAVLHEMIRVSRGAVILMEQHRPELGSQRVSRPGGDYWIRDYAAKLKLCSPESAISVQPVTNSLWDAEQWSQCGTLITLQK